MLGRAERAHVSTGTGSVALHPAFLTTKTKLLVLSQRQTQSVSKIDCLTSQTVSQTLTWDTMKIIYDGWFRNAIHEHITSEMTSCAFLTILHTCCVRTSLQIYNL